MRRAIPIAIALAACGCVNVDSYFFAPREVDGYQFDVADPELAGDLSEPHPSIIGPEDRREGFVHTSDGAIHWVMAVREGATDAILYSHGNAIHLGRYWDRVELLWSMGFTVMIYDYPGYGRSEGQPSEAGVFDSAQAVLEQLAVMQEVEGARIWLYGYSLGGAPTFELAARSERGDAPEIAGMIGESVWCSVEDVLQDGAEVDVPGSYFTDLRMDNCARMRELASTPVMLMHGTDDTVIPIRHLTLLDQAAVSTELTVHRVAGAGHADLPTVAGADYARWIDAFVFAH